MSIRSVILAVIVAAAPALSAWGQAAWGQPITIPQNTVIPVVLDTALSSATSRMGDRFTAHCTGPNCGGFPAMTIFSGVVTNVTPKSGSTPGKIQLRLTEAILPDHTRVAIQAIPSSQAGVATPEKTGKSAKKGAKTVGTAAGGVIGAIFGGWGGAAIGAASGYILGTVVKGKNQDVSASAGTKGYIMLTQPVTIPRR